MYSNTSGKSVRRENLTQSVEVLELFLAPSV